MGVCHVAKQNTFSAVGGEESHRWSKYHSVMWNLGMVYNGSTWNYHKWVTRWNINVYRHLQQIQTKMMAYRTFSKSLDGNTFTPPVHLFTSSRSDLGCLANTIVFPKTDGNAYGGVAGTRERSHCFGRNLRRKPLGNLCFLLVSKRQWFPVYVYLTK